MKYIIVENESFALQSLKQMVTHLHPDYQLVFTAESVESVVKFFQTGVEVDFALMDIELVDGNCFEIFDLVHVEIPIIFTTAYDEYAIRAFQVNSIGYLLKPIMEKDVQAALDKLEIFMKRQQTCIDYAKLYQYQKLRNENDRILLCSGESYSYARFSDISFFLSEDRYVFAYLTTGSRRITEYANLSEVENEVDVQVFFRLSRSIVANISSIVSVKKYFNGRLKVVVCAGETCQEVIISAVRKQSFLNWMGGHY